MLNISTLFARLSTVTHPHLNPPLEGEEIDKLSPFKGETERGMG